MDVDLPGMNSETKVIELQAPGPSLAARAAWLPLVFFSLGHFCVDLYSSALGVLQPLLIERFHMSFTQAGVLGGVLVFSSSVMQPAYGYLSDRFHSRLFTVLAPAVAGVFISSLGWAPGFWALLAMAALGGAGIASFHPQAAANATAGLKHGRQKAMAIFISAGTVGFALGPTLFSAITGRWGLDRAAWAAVPGVALSALMLSLAPPLAPREGGRPVFDWTPLRAVWRPMLILYFLVFIRSIVQITFAQFLPLYLNLERGYTLSTASHIVSLYLLAGAIGGFAGGHLADRFGGRRIIILSMIGSTPFLALFLFGHGPLSIAGLIVGGLILLFTIPVNVVMAQELIPAQAGTVSALMMGFAWGMAGMLFIPLTGWISDVFSLQHAMGGLIAAPVLGFLLALRLPKHA